MIKLINNFILLTIAITLWIPIEIISILTVVKFYGKGVYSYFENGGLTLDILSASRHRLLWNKLFIKKNGYKFYKDTDKTISRILGINEWLGTLTHVGQAIVYILWAIDVKHWFNGGHSFQSMKGEDFKKYNV